MGLGVSQRLKLEANNSQELVTMLEAEESPATAEGKVDDAE